MKEAGPMKRIPNSQNIYYIINNPSVCFVSKKIIRHLKNVLCQSIFVSASIRKEAAFPGKPDLFRERNVSVPAGVMPAWPKRRG